MNKIHAKRLLNVAKALRESKNPKRFTMETFINGDSFDSRDEEDTKDFCGTPACALGHYGSRRDLQRFMRIYHEVDDELGGYTHHHLMFTDSDILVLIDDERINDHFGIDYDQVIELFGSTGCGGAKTPIQAAKYIEKFVKKQLKA